MTITVDQLSDKIEHLYWTSAKREVCNMMLFFLEMQSNMDMYEAQNEIPECPNFEKMFKIWSKYSKPLDSSRLVESRLNFIAGGQGARTKDFSTRRLFEDTLERAKRKRKMASTTVG